MGSRETTGSEVREKKTGRERERDADSSSHEAQDDSSSSDAERVVSFNASTDERDCLQQRHRYLV